MAKDVGSIRPWDPGYAERMRLALAAGLRKAGASNYRANDVSGRIFGLLDFVPGVDVVKGGVDTVDAYNAGDMTGAGIGAAATLLGVVPVVGDAAGKAVKKAGMKEIRKGVAKAKSRVATTGQYVGAPAGVDSPQSLGKIRQTYEDTAIQGADGRDWYSDASKWIDRASPAGREQAVADVLGITSAGTGVDTNLGFTVKGLNQLAAGEPVETGRFPKAMSKLINEVTQGNRAHLGPKRQPFADNLSVNWNPDQARHPVHDIWDGRAWGYTGPNGKPWDAGFGPAQHAFMDEQAQFVIDRMNRNKAGGFDDWNPLNVQAAAWTGAKIRAGDIDPSDAAKHYGDFSKKYEASATHEQVPGVGTGHMEGTADLPYALREELGRGATWRNAKGQDSIYASGGLLVEPTRSSVGTYTPPGGKLEVNPAEVARPLVTTENNRVRDLDRMLLNIGEGSRAYVDAQNAGAWHKVVGNPQGVEEMKGLLLPISGAPTERQMRDLSQIAKDSQMFVVDGGDGTLRMINDEWAGDVGKNRTGKTLLTELKKGELGQKLRGAGFKNPEELRATIDKDYISYEDEWRAGQGSDAATSKFLGLLDQNPTFAASIEPALREKAGANLVRDEAFSAKQGLRVRQDIQTARRILSEQGIAGLRAAIGKGILPAAVLGIVLSGQGGGSEPPSS